MSTHNKARRGRSRKRRNDGAGGAQAGGRRQPSRPKSGSRSRATQRASGGLLASAARVGERPRAPWHPLPLSELLIVVGIIGAIVGFSRHPVDGPALFAGIGAVVVGTGEFSLREHLGGYRSHALMLSAIPVLVLDTALAFGAAAVITPVPVALKVAVLVLDVPLLVFLYRLLRARFEEARRARVFMGAR